MKKFLTILSLAVFLAAIAAVPSFAATKKALSEHFTNASCPPCATLSPQYVAYLLQNLDKVVPVAYHTSGPGRDPMYSENPNMHNARTSYYQISAVPTVIIEGNKYKGNDLNQIKGTISSQASKTTPITITVDQKNVGYDFDVSIKVHSTSAYSGKKLYAAVIESYHYFPDAGTNGEKDFYFICRAMLPDHNGMDFSINANEEKTINYSFKASKSWYPSMIYVAAWVQDDATKEVFQAGSSPIPSNLASAPSTPRMGVTLEIQKRHGKIKNGQSDTRDIVIRNSNNREITVALDISNSSFPQGWSVDLDKDEVTVPANGTATVEATIMTNQNNGLAIINISAVPVNLTNAFPLETVNFLSALSEDSKYSFYVNSHNAPAFMFNSFVAEIKDPQYTAIIPYFAEFFTAYPPKDFDIALFCFDQPYRGSLSASGELSSTAINAIKAMITAGKKVIITGELELYNASTQQGTGEAKDFFGNILAIAHSGDPRLRVTVNDQGYITAVNSYPLMGLSNDPIADGVNITMNLYLQNHQAFNIFTDIIAIKPGSKSKAFLYGDNVPSNIMGIRYESGDAKLVFMTCGFEGIADQPKRNDLMKRILKWFEGATTGPIITLDKEKIEFGDVNIGQQKTQTFKISNTGAGPLSVSKVEVEFSYSHIYDVTPKGPLTIQPGASNNFTVTFKPIDELNRTVKLTITSNGTNGTVKTIDLTGKGIDMSSVKDGVASNGEISMSLTPNPVSDKSTVNYTISGFDSKYVEIYLINQAGARVSEVFSGLKNPGEHTTHLNSVGLPSGTYYLLLKTGDSILDLPVVIVK